MTLCNNHVWSRYGKQTKQVTTLGGNLLGSLSTYYDPAGNAIRVVDDQGRKAQTRYNPARKPVEVTEAAGTPLERHSYTAYYLDGRPWQQVDALGLATLTSYDDRGSTQTVTATQA